MIIRNKVGSLIWWFCVLPGLLVAYGCGGGACPEGERRVANETVLSFEEFRNGIEWLDPQPIGTNGKIVVYKNFLFILEPFLGVHVYDNSTQVEPLALGLLNIPGNSDIYLKEDVLYADSYTDLVKFEVQDDTPVEKSRIELAFANAYKTNDEGIVTGTSYTCR